MTIDRAQQAIIDEFAALDDGFEQYEHLVRLGKASKRLDDCFKTDDHALSGCQSQVWIRSALHDGRLHFQTDSDSDIVRGILSLFLRVLNGRTPAEIAAARIHFLDTIGLSRRLSPSRANGAATILRHLQSYGATQRNA